jgi:serine/threonine-protein kinase
VNLDRRALALVEAALDQPRTEREAAIRAGAAGDAELEDEALALLAEHDRAGAFLEPALDRMIGSEIGPYRVLGRLGAGGMGEVFLAERSDGSFARRVAIKALALAHTESDLVRRAEDERRFLAQLEHPHVARILDGGRLADGRPYVVMEYVDGNAIDHYCRERGLDIAARVRLFLQVIDAVDAAHRALIIHRDLKPSNVLVTREGQAKLLDFGIAKSLEAGMGATQTRAGLGPMTPRYASPEQLAGRRLTTASDIYGLGLLLYELLTGRLPFDYGERSLLEVSQWLESTAPPRPSMQLDAAALDSSPDRLQEWRRRLAGDLDRVVLKALAVDPTHRYASAREFGADLENWLAFRPVRARSGERLYRARLFVRRNRVAVAAASAAVLALTLGLAVAAQQARIARAEAARATSTSEFLQEIISAADPTMSGREPTLLEALDAASARIATRFAGQPDTESGIRHALGNAYTNLVQLPKARAQLDAALALREPDTVPYAELLKAVAVLDWSEGDTGSAERRYREALAIVDDHDDAAARELRGEILNDLAVLQTDIGRPADAVPLAEQAVALGRASGLADRKLGTRLSVLGNALASAGRESDSLVAFDAAHRLLEANLPATTIDLSINFNNLAFAHQALGQPQQALTAFERALELRRDAFGPEHPSLCATLVNVAVLRAELGEIDSAERDMDQALALATAAFAPEYIASGHVRLGAARVAVAAGDWGAAHEHAGAALAVYERADAVEAEKVERARSILAEAELHLAQR